ncbi:Pxr1, partial [Ophiophagus hannah]
REEKRNKEREGGREGREGGREERRRGGREGREGREGKEGGREEGRRKGRKEGRKEKEGEREGGKKEGRVGRKEGRRKKGRREGGREGGGRRNLKWREFDCQVQFLAQTRDPTNLFLKASRDGAPTSSGGQQKFLLHSRWLLSLVSFRPLFSRAAPQILEPGGRRDDVAREKACKTRAKLT